MKNNKILKNIAIIISVILLISDICLYIKMKYTWSEIGSNHHQYENASLIITGLFRYGALMWGILLILLVWLEYFLIKLFIKIYNNCNGFKKNFLCLITLVIISMIFLFFISILSLIIMTLM